MAQNKDFGLTVCYGLAINDGVMLFVNFIVGKKTLKMKGRYFEGGGTSTNLEMRLRCRISVMISR